MTAIVTTLARPRHQRLLHDSLLTAAADTPDKPAIVAKEAQLSYAELLDQAARLAAALQQEGLERGERVAIFMDNTAACCISIFAAPLCMSPATMRMATKGSRNTAATSQALKVGAQIPTSGENASPTPIAVPPRPLASP